MKITLRKANTIQNSINDVVKNINLVDVVSINEFQNSESVIANRAQQLSKDFHRKIALTNALYSIRTAVAEANAGSGVDQRLTEVARLDKLIALYQQFAGFSARTEEQVLVGKLNKIRNRKEDSARSLYGNDEVTTGVATEQDITSAKSTISNLKKSKQKLQDEILELNVRTEIVVNEQTQTVLIEEGIL